MSEYPWSKEKITFIWLSSLYNPFNGEICVNELCYILIISIFNFLIFKHLTNQIILKPSLAQKLKLIFKFSTIMEQINVPLWTHMGHKGWRKDGKTFTRCYTIALKCWDEFKNANFVLLYFSSYRSKTIWHLYLKNVEKNNKTMHLRLLFTYMHQNLFNIKKNLVLLLKKNCTCTFLCIVN